MKHGLNTDRREQRRNPSSQPILLIRVRSVFHPWLNSGVPMPFATVLHSVSYAGVWTGQVRLPLADFLRKAKTLGFDGVMLMAKRPHLSVLDFDAKACAELRRLV